MKQIYVLDDNNQHHLIDAGITQYAELSDAPIASSYKGELLKNSTITLKGDQITIGHEDGHKWTKDELIWFCTYAEDGRYDICTELRGYEILLIDSTDEQRGRRYRRISASQDDIYNHNSKEWVAITNTNYDQLIVKLLNQEEINEKNGSTVVGEKFKLDFYYYSSVGPGTVTVLINGLTYTAGTAKSGEQFTVDLTNRLVDGPNSITVTFTNIATSKIIPTIDINGINIKYIPEFDQYSNFSDTVVFDYSADGSVKKQLFWEITNSEGKVSYTSVNEDVGYVAGNVQLSKDYFSHGENYITTYMRAIDDSGRTIVESEKVYYKIPFLTNDEPLLMVYREDWDNLKQFTRLSIPYRVWKRGEKDTKEGLQSINFSIISSAFSDGIIESSFNAGEQGAQTSYLQYNAAHSWEISSLPTTYVTEKDDRLATFEIIGSYKSSNESDILLNTNKFSKSGVSIKSSSSEMETVGNYLFNFDAALLEKATDTWVSPGDAKKTLSLSGFNWNTDGIQKDENGDPMLHFSAPSKAVLNEETNPLFGPATQLFTLEIGFKVPANSDNKVVAKYYDPTGLRPDDEGLFIYPNKSVFKYGGKSVEVNYIAGEKTVLTYTIFHKNVTDIDLDDPEKNFPTVTSNLFYLLVYVNGILSKMQLIDGDTFPSKCGTMEFNSYKGNFDLYTFRGYNSSLTSQKILQNYISSFGDPKAKEQKFENNKLYSSTSTGVPGEMEIDFESVKGKIPVYVIVCDRLPRSKNYVKCLGIYYEKDGETMVEPGGWVKDLGRDLKGIPKATTYYYYREALEYDANNEPIKFTAWKRSEPIEVGGQGTSSLNYPRHNFKFKHDKKNKFYIKGHTNGPDRTFTFKADYMDSSGANNICNAQILDNAIIRNEWKSVHKIDGKDVIIPTPAYNGSRVNLDGFPVAVFWCESKDLKGGVKQGENVEDVFDHDGNPLNDAVTPSIHNKLIGEVIPNNPKYIGTFNFNYDKKATKLLGWDKKTFQGFEFRGSSSNCDLFRGFENFLAMMSTSEGFEWRWTYDTDTIDDYYDGHLGLLIDGGYVDEDVKQLYSEAEYLADRVGDEEIAYIEPYNRYYIERNGEQLQLVIKNEDDSYTPINYCTINPSNASWNITDYEGISKGEVHLEYGVKIGKKNNVLSFLYQLPYGVSSTLPRGKAYDDGSHYYSFEWNPEHTFYFNINTETAKFTDNNGVIRDYYNEEEFWTALAPLEKVKALHITYELDENGEYVYDSSDKKYFKAIDYPAETELPIERYNKIIEFIDVEETDTIITWDYMKNALKNWCYVNEAVARCDASNCRAILDSNQQYTDPITGKSNGWGLFIWDSLTNYMAASMIVGLCDNFAKNMFMHSYDKGLTWSPAWYDMDTCFGLNNEGGYTKPYDLDFYDLDMLNSKGFNGSDSHLWMLVHDYISDSGTLQQKYKKLRDEGYISYAQIMKIVDDDNISWKAESLYNANAVYRYIEPFWNENVKTDAAQGNRLQFLKYWNKNRQVFLDSLFESKGWTGDKITLRPNTTDWKTITLTPDTNMYLGANFNSSNADIPSVKSDRKILANESWVCELGPSTNLNTYIYGASHLIDVGDLGILNATEYSLGNAINIKKIKIGDDNRVHEVATELNLSSIEPYNNLTEIDLQYVTPKSSKDSLTLVTDFNITPALETLKMRGSGFTKVSIAPYTPLKYYSLPEKINTITLNSLLDLETVVMPQNLDYIREINITNCPKISQYNIIKDLEGFTIEINIDNLNISEEEAVNIKFMQWLYDKNAILNGGTVYVKSVKESLLDPYKEKWGPNLKIEWKQIIEEEAIFGVSGEGE